MKILMAGCGAMGFPMAKALLNKGFDVSAFDPKPCNALIKCAMQTVDHPQDADADVVIIVVRDKHEIDALCFSEQALFATSANPEYPAHVILCSTVSLATVHNLRSQLPPEVSLIDAPMSGAPLAAENASLSFMVGGDADLIETHRPLFEAMGKHVFVLGALGSGMQVKTLNNTVAATTVAVVRRVLADAKAGGIDPDRLLEVMAASSGSTWFGDNFHAINWSRETYARNNTIGILEKDVLCALESVDRETDDFDQALLQALKSLPA